MKKICQFFTDYHKRSHPAETVAHTASACCKRKEKDNGHDNCVDDDVLQINTYQVEKICFERSVMNPQEHDK